MREIAGQQTIMGKWVRRTVLSSVPCHSGQGLSEIESGVLLAFSRNQGVRGWLCSEVNKREVHARRGWEPFSGGNLEIKYPGLELESTRWYSERLGQGQIWRLRTLQQSGSVGIRKGVPIVYSEPKQSTGGGRTKGLGQCESDEASSIPNLSASLQMLCCKQLVKPEATIVLAPALKPGA